MEHFNIKPTPKRYGYFGKTGSFLITLFAFPAFLMYVFFE